jgi:PAS domain S-box-containing protein
MHRAVMAVHAGSHVVFCRKMRKDGSQLSRGIPPTLVRDENREIIGAVVIFNDITESKRAEQELHHAKEAAKAASFEHFPVS